MTKKKWFLLILLGLVIFGWFKLFYKTYSNTVVAKNADYVVAIDVKRIIQTVIWNKITTPGKWKIGNPFSSKKGAVSWNDMVKIPDYVFLFHLKDQPANAWYVLMNVKDEERFKEGIVQYHFEKAADNQYVSREYDISILKNGNELLISNAAVEDPAYLKEVAREMFTDKTYADKTTIKQLIDARSHATLWIQPNSFLDQSAVITANFDKEQIQICGNMIPKKAYVFNDNAFTYSAGQLFALRFSQPTPEVYKFLTDSAKLRLSKALNFNIDSLMLPSNHSYQMDIAGIQPKVDSAITYTYDDDFNKVEKVVVNNVLEPTVNFVVVGDSIQHVFNYWQRNDLFEQTKAGNLFTAIPFVKAYAASKPDKQLTLASLDYKIGTADKKIQSLFFMRTLLTQIPNDILNYTPDKILNIIKGIESIEVELKKHNAELIIESTITAKQSALPIIGN